MVETLNRFLVGVRRGRVHIMNPAVLGGLSREDCLLLAAYLVLLAPQGPDTFDDYLRAVRSPSEPPSTQPEGGKRCERCGRACTRVVDGGPNCGL